MVTLLQPLQVRTWAKAIPPTPANAIANPVVEFGPTDLPVLSGAIPEGLRGSLYRNGPAVLARGGEAMGHWFDGDGAILGVHFSGSGAVGLYRYIQTAGYQAESRANKLLYCGYGTIPSIPYWQRFAHDAKNVANTSVIAVPGKLLALWEGGQPHALDLQTLETIGLDDLGKLKGDLRYSAHPKRDWQTGDLYNFGIGYGLNSVLNVYRSDRSGRIQQHKAIALKGVSMVHDFFLAGPYLVFCIPPVRINVLPALLRLQTFSDASQWTPEQGTEILVLDRHTLEVVSRAKAEPWYQWHFGNGYVDVDGSIVTQLVRYENFLTNQYLQQVATGKTNTHAIGTLWQMRLDPKTAKVLEMYPLSDRGCEFPIVPPQQVGQVARFVYMSMHRPGVDVTQEMFGAIARVDTQTGTVTEADLGDNCYPMEPIYAPDPANPDRGWILTVVFDGNKDRSEVWVLDSDRLNDEPVCRLGLPHVVPLGFHGTWNAQ